MNVGSSFRRRRALTILEVVVSIVILTVVLGTYGSAALASQRLLYELKQQPIYTRLAFLQLERMMDLVHRLELPEKQYYSGRGIMPELSFSDITKIFSFEGRSGNLDSYNAADDARIPLLQMQIYGLDNDAGERFLSFPFPEELKIGYNSWDHIGNISPPDSTLHHITSFLQEEKSGSDLLYRSVLPLVSDEYLRIVDLDQSDPKDRYSEIGWQDGGSPLAAEDVPTLLPIQLFTDDISKVGYSDHNALDYERIRRYVYYRKIRENNIVFRNGVMGRKDTGDDASVTFAHFLEAETDIDMLYVQNLNDWIEEGGSSNGGEVSGIEGSADQKSDGSLSELGIGALGAHSIMIMVVLRELPPELSGAYSEAEFLKEAPIKAVAVGIAAPSFGKNILSSSDLSYHRYAGTRIPGIKMR